MLIFSTFFTDTLHGKLIRNLNEHTDFCFKGRYGELIAVDRNGTQWRKRLKIGSISFTRDFLKKTVKYLFYKCYFKLHNKIFRQYFGFL